MFIVVRRQRFRKNNRNVGEKEVNNLKSAIMEREKILEKLLPIIQRTTFNKEITHLNEEDDFKNTLCMDSLDMTSLAIRCEQEFNVVFEGEELKIKKVGELIDFIQGLS